MFCPAGWRFPWPARPGCWCPALSCISNPGIPTASWPQGPDPAEVLILYAPAGLERLIAEAGIADPENPQASRRAAIRSIEDAATLKAAARAYGVDYVDVAASKSK